MVTATNHRKRLDRAAQRRYGVSGLWKGVIGLHLLLWLPVVLGSRGYAPVLQASAAPVEEGLPAVKPGERVVLGRWICSGQPSRDRVIELAKSGIPIVNFRTAKEMPFDEKAIVDSLGGSYRQFGVTSRTFDDPAALAKALEILDEAKKTSGPVFIHCASGNRVGALVAIHLARREGADPSRALEVGRAAGLTRLEPKVRRLLEGEAARGRVGSEKE